MSDGEPSGCAFDALYRQHAPGIRTYVFRRTSDAELAADLCQETFVKALAAMQTGTEVQHVSGWLYRIAHNLVIDHYRKRDKVAMGSLDSMFNRSQTRIAAAERGSGKVTVELGDYLPDPSDQEAEIVARLDVADALPALTDLQRTVIRLREMEGCPYLEIADEMEMTEGAVKALRHRAIVSLRERMAA